MAAEKGPSLLSATLASGSSLVLLQVFSRVVTFVLNQALVRLVSPQVFGTTSIQFELLLSTILFLSREGVRNALLRASSQNTTDRSATNPLVTTLRASRLRPSSAICTYIHVSTFAEDMT